MSKDDADTVQKIFAQRDDPKFIIVNKHEVSEDTIQLELLADSIVNIWYLAKTVQVYQDHDERMKKLIEDLHKNNKNQ